MSNNVVKFTVNLGGNAYQGLVNLGEATDRITGKVGQLQSKIIVLDERGLKGDKSSTSGLISFSSFLTKETPLSTTSRTPFCRNGEGGSRQETTSSVFDRNFPATYAD